MKRSIASGALCIALALLAGAVKAAGQAPADPLCLPAILAKPTPPEAAEMLRRSEV